MIPKRGEICGDRERCVIGHLSSIQLMGKLIADDTAYAASHVRRLSKILCIVVVLEMEVVCPLPLTTILSPKHAPAKTTEHLGDD